MVRVLSDAAVAEVLSLPPLVSIVEEALLAQGRGAVERPDRPHFPVGIDVSDSVVSGTAEDPAGTALTMPAYIHGRETFATKLVSVHESNATRGVPTVNAQIVLTDATTGQPLAYMDGTRITNARTGCIGGLAARELADEPVDLGVLGAGTQARWQTRAIAATTDLRRVRVYSPSESREACAADLRDELDGVEVSAVDSPGAVVTGATVVVAATTAHEPVFDGDALGPGTLVIAIGAYTADMQELDAATMARADRVIADVPEEVAGIGDVIETGVDPGALEPLSAVLSEDGGPERTPGEDGIVVVESVGTAVLDAAAAEYAYDEAVDRDVGLTLSL